MTPLQFAIQWLNNRGFQATEDTVVPDGMGLDVVLCVTYLCPMQWQSGMTVGAHVRQIPAKKAREVE